MFTCLSFYVLSLVLTQVTGSFFLESVLFQDDQGLWLAMLLFLISLVAAQHYTRNKSL